jgi:PST family polysaccharide transporter
VLGVLWTVTTSAGARAVGLAGTLLITRYLDPGEYGEVSLASVVILTASTLSNCGLSQYLVSQPNAGRDAAFHATFYYTLLGVLAIGLALLLGDPIGALIHAPTLGRFLPGLAIAALLERAGTVQDRIQIRDMRFRSVGLIHALGEVVYSGVSVALAAQGAGKWWGGGNAVVVASIARSAARLVALSLTTDRRAWLSPCPITWQKTRELFAFGLPMSIATIAGVGSRRWDNLVFSHHFGQAAAGLYNLAYNLADVPATQIGETIGDVLVPSFAAMEEGPRRERALSLALRQITLLIAPLALGLGAVATPLCAALFDKRWAGLDVELALLSGLSVSRPIGWIAGAYLQVQNRPRLIMILESAKTASVVVVMHLFALYARRYHAAGEWWACASVGFVFGASALSYLWAIKKGAGISLTEQLGAIAPPLLACVPMVVVVIVAERALAPVAPPAARLITEVLLGALVFIPSAFLLAPRAARELCDLIERTLLRRTVAS